MRTSVLLMITAIIYGLYGLAFLFAPTLVIGQYGGEIGSIGAFTTELYGASIIGMATMCWLAKDAERDTAFKALLMGMFIAITLVTIVVVVNQFRSPTVSDWAWFLVFVQTLLASGFGYARFGPDRPE